MKRRKFIRNASLGTSGLFVAANQLEKKPFNIYSEIPVLKKVEKIEDILNENGEVMLRVEFFDTGLTGRTDYKSRITVKNGNIKKTKKYFFENYEDEYDDEENIFKGTAGAGTSDILVIWLDESSPETQIQIKGRNHNVKFSLEELINNKEEVLRDEDSRISINYLLDREIGKIDPSDYGINTRSDDYTFALMADPQGGDPFLRGDSNVRLRIHNTWVEESVRVINELKPEPLFTLIVGDIVDGQGPEAYFTEMEKYFSKLNTPVLYEIGNHESKYSAKFEPGYNQEEFRNYYESQMRINGMDKLLYSFDLGKWHFIVWPDPLRNRFWERHPHYFDWLEKDLEEHKNMPVMVFHHVPAHPIGINPLTEYAESPYVKRTFTDILAKLGNVKYVLSGHVHIPLRASVKTAVEYKGMKFINLPAAGYRPRAFGESDLYGGVTEGIGIVNIKGENASIDFKNVMNDVYSYPEKLRKLDSEEFPFWFNFRWELPKNEKLLNGNFEEGLKHWKKRYVYLEDDNPTNIQEIRTLPTTGKKALYLFTANKKFDTAGQDRLPQDLNRVAQIINVDPGKQILLSMDYIPEDGIFDMKNRSSFYIWLEGYEKSTKRLNIVYAPGYHFFPIERNYSQHKLVDPMRMELPANPGKWHKLLINPWKDFRETTEMKNYFLDNIDRFIINLGVWTINDGYQQRTGVYFSDLGLQPVPSADNTQSKADGVILKPKDNRFMIWGGADHIAGEHIAYRSDMNFYGKE
ncbi:MAG: metallophosphoesterase family protein [Bacteroidota bacterium]